MKKLVKLLLCFTLVAFSIVPIAAKQADGFSNEYLKNVSIVTHDRMLDGNIDQGRKDVTVTAYSVDDGFNIKTFKNVD